MVFGQIKLIYDQTTKTMRMFDLSQDRQERHNIADMDTRPELAHMLGQWLAYINTKRKAGPAPDFDKLFTPKQLEQLKSLGYLQ